MYANYCQQLWFVGQATLLAGKYSDELSSVYWTALEGTQAIVWVWMCFREDEAVGDAWVVVN